MKRTRALQVARPSQPLNRERLLAQQSPNPPKDDNSSHVIPITQKLFCKQTPAPAASTSTKTTSSPAVLNHETLSIHTFLREDDAKQPEKDEQVNNDPAIEEKVYLGLRYVKEDWKQQGQLIDNLQKEVVSMRTEVSKTTAPPVEVRKASNDISGLGENVNIFVTDFIEVRADMLGLRKILKQPRQNCRLLRNPATLSKETPL